MEYVTRYLEQRIRLLESHFKVVLVQGARQVGKSTMLSHMHPELRTIVFDPILDRFGARSDPDLFLDSFPGPLILDEVQYAPELLSAIKRRVDQSPRFGQYLLTGSQNLGVLDRISETLAGRVAIVELEGFAPGELRPRPHSWLEAWLNGERRPPAWLQGHKSERNLVSTLWRGSLPGVQEMPDRLVPNFWSSYLQTYVERDVRSDAQPQSLEPFGRFVGVSAGLTAQEINDSQLGREVGVAPGTAQRWRGMLRRGFQWYELPPCGFNAVKRVSGKRKGHMAEAALACHLQRINSPEALAVSPLLGPIFESWVVGTVRKGSSLLAGQPGFSHWRSNGGAEVDLVLEWNGQWFPLEVKCKSTLSGHDLKGIQAFRATYPDRVSSVAVVVYAGELVYQAAPDIWALPWHAL